MSTNKRETTQTTPGEFRDLADRMAQIAESYRAIADAMERRSITHLDVIGMDTLENVTLPRLSGSLASANRALTTYKKPTESQSTAYKVAEDPEKLRIASDAAKANKTAADRKKKKSE